MRRRPRAQAALLEHDDLFENCLCIMQSAPSPPEPNVVSPNGPKELCRGLFVCVPL